MALRLTLILALFFAVHVKVCAQPGNGDCATATNLCNEDVLAGNNTGSSSIPGFCAGTEAAVWYTFTTNSVGGTVDVAITGVDCPSVVGMGNELSAVVLTGDGSCTLTSFAARSTCVQDSEDFTFTTFALQPETRYWILVAGAIGGMNTSPAQCDFNVSISGTGGDILDVDVTAGPDVTIGEGENTQLNGMGGNTINWSPTAGLSGSDIPDPIASPVSTTIYTLTTDIAGCTYTDDMILEVIRRIEPPNTFTPNGDGINDTWNIPGMADYPGAEITIHDRWGQIVLKSTGYREPWDGTRNGRVLSVGTYYYHIQLNQLEGRSPPYTGFVTIIR